MANILNDLLKTLGSAISGYIKEENNSGIGKFNLAGGIVVAILILLGLVPSFVADILKIILNRTADWTALIPLGAILFLVFYFSVCLKMIPREPPPDL